MEIIRTTNTAQSTTRFYVDAKRVSSKLFWHVWKSAPRLDCFITEQTATGWRHRSTVRGGDG